MSKQWEREMAERFESKLAQTVYKDSKYIIRRDHQLISSEKEIEKHELRLYANGISSLTACNISNVDAIIIDRITKGVELIIEYECDTNPKNLLGNLFAPILADYYVDYYDKERGIYNLSNEYTHIIVISCLPIQREKGTRNQAPIEKGKILEDRNWKNCFQESKIKTGICISGDDINDVINEAIGTVQSWISGA